jgi:peptidyl-prolyl cis-trans isomerase C
MFCPLTSRFYLSISNTARYTAGTFLTPQKQIFSERNFSMRTLISVFAVLVIGTLSQTFAADAQKAAPAPAKIVAPAKPAAPAVAIETNEPAVDPNAVVLTIGDTKVTEGRLAKIIAPRMKQSAGRVPENMMGQYKQQMRRQAMEQMIIETMLAEKEKAKNITVSEEEVAEQINKQIAQQNLTVDDFKSLLKAYGVEYSEYQENMKKRALFEKLMDTEFAGKIKEPNAAEIKAYYDENAQQQFVNPEKIHAKHILIRPADGNDPNKAKLEAKTKAQELLAKIKGGAEFETVAKESSACPSAKNGGDLGAQPKGTFVPEFEKAAYALKPGEISDVVETQFGYHIIKLVEHSDANTVSLEDAKEKIVAALGDKQKEQIVMDYIQNLKSEANVTFANEADKFELKAPKPAAVAPPVRKAEPKAAEVKVADANAPKEATPAVKAASDKKTDKKVDKKVDKKADKKAKKKADKKK